MLLLPPSPTNRSGSELDPRDVAWRVWDPAVARTGLGELTPHDLRHTAASLAISSGATVKHVQRMLGHQSAAMTLDTYAGLFDSDLDALTDRLDAAIAAAPPAAQIRALRLER